jgi:hypothetical protein
MKYFKGGATYESLGNSVRFIQTFVEDPVRVSPKLTDRGQEAVILYTWNICICGGFDILYGGKYTLGMDVCV